MTGTTYRITGRTTGASIALAAALTLGTPFVVGAHAADLPNPTQSAAFSVQEQLAAGGGYLSVETDFGTYIDYGVTADAVFALAASGTGADQAAATTAYLADNVVNYTGFGDPSEVYAGSVAKLVNLAVATNQDPRAFGGQDLVETLVGLEAESGRFSDDSAYGDYSNTFGQSLAIMGLKRAGVNPSPAAIDFLLEQQCPGGGFQLYMDASPCTDAANSDPDATALAVQALLAAGGASSEATAGLDYLASRQGGDGGVGGGGPQTAANANSTGLAGQAFLAGGRSAQAGLARAYILSLQYGCEFPESLRGGIAYDPAAFAAQEAKGETATPDDQDRRSTTQALLALAGAPLYAVTTTGADAVAPAPVCPEPEPTTPSVPPTDTAPTGTDQSTTTGGGGTAAPVVTGPVVETDLPADEDLWGSTLGGATLALLMIVGGIAAATVRRGEHR